MIRLFNLNDIECIMKIWLESNLDVHNFINKDYYINNYKFVEEEMKKSKIYIYEENEIIYGFVGINDGFIEGLFVIKNNRSKGIGKKLIDFCKQKNNILSLKVYKKNKRALKFYIREKFKIEEETIDDENNEIEYKMVWNYDR